MTSDILVNTDKINGNVIGAPSHYLNQYWLNIIKNL